MAGQSWSQLWAAEHIGLGGREITCLWWSGPMPRVVYTLISGSSLHSFQPETTLLHGSDPFHDHRGTHHQGEAVGSCSPSHITLGVGKLLSQVDGAAYPGEGMCDKQA